MDLVKKNKDSKYLRESAILYDWLLESVASSERRSSNKHENLEIDVSPESCLTISSVGDNDGFECLAENSELSERATVGGV